MNTPPLLTKAENPIEIENEDQIDEGVKYDELAAAKTSYMLQSIWKSENAAIGITRVILSDDKSIYYEVLLSFPEMKTEWRVWRMYREFVELHQLLSYSFQVQLNQRNIIIPKPSRLQFEYSRAARAEQSAIKLVDKLNSYLHKLLEIEAIHSSVEFQGFFHPRPQDINQTSKSILKLLYDSPALLSLPSTISTTSTLTSLTSLTSSSLSQSSLDINDADLSTTDLVVTTHSDLPSPSVLTAFTSDCVTAIQYGQSLTITTCGGLRVGLNKRSALSGSQKAAAVAAGVAGVALSGPLAAVFALGAVSSVGKYQFSKTYCLSVQNRNELKHNEFVFENTTPFSGPERKVKYNDILKLYNLNVKKSIKVAQPADSRRGYCMVTNSNSDSAVYVKIISPYNHTGNVTCGSYVMLQIVSNPSNQYTNYTTTSTTTSQTNGTSSQSNSNGYSSGRQWENEYLGVHKEFITTGNPFGMFKICIHNHPCKANEYYCHNTKSSNRSSGNRVDTRSRSNDVVMETPASSGSSTGIAPHCQLTPAMPSETIRFMVYNVWLMPKIVTSILNVSPFKTQRAIAISDQVVNLNLDVILFCEAFCGTTRSLLIRQLKKYGYLYETRNVGHISVSNKKAINSGMFAVSKYPIRYVDEVVFGNIAIGDDKMADKGVIYFQIQTRSNTICHIFGTHLQAWDSVQALEIRKQQLQVMKAFIDSKEIGLNEIVLIGGDFNIDKYTTTPSTRTNSTATTTMTTTTCTSNAISISREYYEMLDILNCEEPKLKADSNVFSFDPSTNTLAAKGLSSSGKQERLDYILYGRKYRPPVHCESEIVMLKASEGWRYSASSSSQNGKNTTKTANIHTATSMTSTTSLGAIETELKEFSNDTKSSQRNSRSGSGFGTEIFDLSDHYPILTEFQF